MSRPNENILDAIESVVVEKPADLILDQIRKLIKNGMLRPGDRLPPERVLAVKFGVGRGYVRDAIRKLEFFGVLKTLPQSGTYVADLAVETSDAIISNLFVSETLDYSSILEARTLLEAQAVRLFVEKSGSSGLEKLENAHRLFKRKVESGGNAIEEDTVFHLLIAELCGNSVFRTVLAYLTPRIIKLSNELGTCGDERRQESLAEHEQIMEAIRFGDADGAEQAMRMHLTNSLENYVSISKDQAGK